MSIFVGQSYSVKILPRYFSEFSVDFHRKVFRNPPFPLFFQIWYKNLVILKSVFPEALSLQMLRVIPLEHTELRKTLKTAWHKNRSLVCEYSLSLQALNTGWLEMGKRGSSKMTLFMSYPQSPDWHSHFLNGSAFISTELPTHVTAALLWCGILLCCRAGSFIRLLPYNSLCQDIHGYLQCGRAVKETRLWFREVLHTSSGWKTYFLLS